MRSPLKNFVMRPRLLTLSSVDSKRLNNQICFRVDSSKESKARRRNPATECSAATSPTSRVQTSMGGAHVHTDDVDVDSRDQGTMLGHAYEEMEDAMLLTRSKANRSV